MRKCICERLQDNFRRWHGTLIKISKRYGFLLHALWDMGKIDPDPDRDPQPVFERS